MSMSLQQQKGTEKFERGEWCDNIYTYFFFLQFTEKVRKGKVNAESC